MLTLDDVLSDQPAFINLLRDFDNDAWNLLFDHYHYRLLADINVSLRRRYLDIQEADDVASETWLTAAQKIAELDCDDVETVYHWLRVIAYNKVRNLGRKSRPNMSIQDIEEAESEHDGISLDFFLYTNQLVGEAAERTVERASDRRQLLRALHMLSPRDQEIWLRRHLEGENPAQIAQDYSINSRSVSQTLMRARKKILSYLSNSDLRSSALSLNSPK